MSEAALLVLAAALFGAVIGSFLNALSFRFNTGRGMGGRSRCMHCNHALGALDLVPVLSYLYLRGRCRWCHAYVSLQYPLVEVAAAVLASLTYLTHPEPISFTFWLVVWMILLFTVVYDLRHGIIPWSCSGLLIILALVYVLAQEQITLAVLVSGPLLALPLLLVSAISRGTWMGWGDGTLELSLGWLLGLAAGATALMLAFWSGALVGVSLLYISRLQSKKTMLQFTMRSEIPFAPFLVFGAFLVHFFHVDFFQNVLLF